MYCSLFFWFFTLDLFCMKAFCRKSSHTSAIWCIYSPDYYDYYDYYDLRDLKWEFLVSRIIKQKRKVRRLASFVVLFYFCLVPSLFSTLCPSAVLYLSSMSGISSSSFLFLPLFFEFSIGINQLKTKAIWIRYSISRHLALKHLVLKSSSVKEKASIN